MDICILDADKLSGGCRHGKNDFGKAKNGFIPRL